MFSFDLHEDEKLIKIYRQAESVLLKPGLIVLLLIYVPIWFLLKYDLVQNFAWILAAWTIGVLLYAASTYFRWLVNAYIITNKRVAAVTYSSFFIKNTEEILISDIANIKYFATGIYSSLLNFGSLELESGGKNPLRIANITKPSELKDILWHLKEAALPHISKAPIRQ